MEIFTAVSTAHSITVAAFFKNPHLAKPAGRFGGTNGTAVGVCREISRCRTAVFQSYKSFFHVSSTYTEISHQAKRSDEEETDFFHKDSFVDFAAKIRIIKKKAKD